MLTEETATFEDVRDEYFGKDLVLGPQSKYSHSSSFARGAAKASWTRTTFNKSTKRKIGPPIAK